MDNVYLKKRPILLCYAVYNNSSLWGLFLTGRESRIMCDIVVKSLTSSKKNNKKKDASSAGVIIQFGICGTPL